MAINIDDVYEVCNINTNSSLSIRTGPSSDNPSIGSLRYGDRVLAKEERDGWLRTDQGDGWCSMKYLKRIGTIEEAKNIPAATRPDDDNIFREEDEGGSGYLPKTDSILQATDYSTNEEFTNIRSVIGCFGLPYQFLPNTDPRIDTSELSGGDVGDNNAQRVGFEYAEKIITRIPLLMIAPGKASFMTRYGKKNKENILQKLINYGVGNTKEEAAGILGDLVDKAGRYYTFEYDETEYYKIVNPMCRIAARYLGIHNVKMNGVNLDNMNWRNFTKSGVRGIGDFGTFISIPFYVDNLSSTSESLSNSTAASMIASAVNSASDMARELRFLLGKDAGAEALENDKDVASNLQNVQDIIGKLLGGNNFLGALSGHLTTVASGGKMMFPEIWSDSQFSRSYGCEFKFISPDPSPLSIYLNILVPLFHLLALVGPRAVDDNPNGYVNPFLVRAIYKGFFNIDTGIITDMSITKGAECQWTPEGIPTSVTVSITIKDLYNALAFTATKSENWKYDTMNNTALMDYIANLCGINIFKPDILRTIDMWYTNNFENRVRDFLSTNIWTNLENKVANLIVNRIFR